MQNNKLLINVIEWYGTIAIVIAYLLISIGIISTDNAIYQLLNLTGALGIIVGAYSKKDYQPVVLNVIWTVIALIALARIFLK